MPVHHWDSFLLLDRSITAERAELETRIAEIEKKRENEETVAFEVDRVVSIGQAARDYRGVTREVLDAVVDDIQINSQGGVEIRYRFEDLYAKALKSLE